MTNYTRMTQHEINLHLADEISKVYDVLIEITKRLDKLDSSILICPDCISKIKGMKNVDNVQESDNTSK